MTSSMMTKSNDACPTGRQPSKSPKQPYLERLVINVSHDCNLRCKYCYADTGAYHANRMKLSGTLEHQIFDDFSERFARIGKIQFFGGEPFLNYKGIESLCNYITDVCQRDGIPLPAFTVISNGTLLNDHIIEIINQHKLVVTISLDGSRSINDIQRVYASGSGSYARVIENIRILKGRTGQPTQIEGTFTARHIEIGFSLVEFMEFLANELDVHFLHMPWIMGQAYNGTGIDPTEKNIARVIGIYSEAISKSFRSLETPNLRDTILISAVDRVLRRASTGGGSKRRHMCPAGSGTLSVGADGKIYPCFMFTNVAQFELGRVGAIQDEEFDCRRSTFTNRLQISDRESGSFETGAACAGHNFEVSGQIDVMTTVSQRIQNALHVHLQDELAKIQANKDRWEWVQTKLILHQLESKCNDMPSARC